MDNYFVNLNNINVNTHTEKKNGLTYLSWAWAWGEVKKLFPDANYTIYQNEAAGYMPYFTDGKTAMVKTGVTINGIEHIEFLPIMDYKNKSIPLEQLTSFDVNKAIQRSLTKACARHGLGLYIYAGEDLPEATSDAVMETAKANGDPVPFSASAKAKYVAEQTLPPEAMPTPVYQPKKKSGTKNVVAVCEACQGLIQETTKKDGTKMTAREIIELSQDRVKKTLCPECLKKELAK